MERNTVEDKPAILTEFYEISIRLAELVARPRISGRTQNTRRALIALSYSAIVILAAELVPTSFSTLGVTIPPDKVGVLYIALAIAIIYLEALFLVRIQRDNIIREARYDASLKTLKTLQNRLGNILRDMPHRAVDRDLREIEKRVSLSSMGGGSNLLTWRIELIVEMLVPQLLAFAAVVVLVNRANALGLVRI